MPEPKLITPGVIADRSLAAPLHRVQNILATRPHIRPSARAGTLRLYDRAAVAMVRHELSAIDARHEARKAAASAQPPRSICATREARAAVL